jgi:hypothetical protein
LGAGAADDPLRAAAEALCSFLGVPSFEHTGIRMCDRKMITSLLRRVVVQEARAQEDYDDAVRRTLTSGLKIKAGQDWEDAVTKGKV